MNKSWIASFKVAIMACLLMQPAGACHFSLFQPSRVPFPNGGFEINPTDPTNGWTWPSNDWVWDRNIAHGGTHSARVSRTSGPETESVWSAYLPIQPSTVYTLTYWLRTDSATYFPSVNLYQFTSNGTQTGLKLVAYANIGGGTNDWLVVHYRFQTMPAAARFQLQLRLYTSTTGTFWFDDFSLDQGPAARFPFQAGFPVAVSGWVGFSSPVVGDINHDGNNELLIGEGNEVNGWNKAGAQLPGFPLTTGDRSISSPVALADLDNDGRLEIVAGTRTPVAGGQCRVFAWRSNGTLLSGWPQSVAWNTQYSHNDCWIPSVVLADIDGDHGLEIAAGTTNNIAGYSGSNPPPAPNLYAWHVNGSLVAGNWPNWQIAGIYGALAAGDLSGDGMSDVIVGRDFYYLNAYASNGQSLPGWPIETYLKGNSGNYHTDYRLEHAVSAPILADLNGDGTTEYIDLSIETGPSNSVIVLNSALLVLEPDGTRRLGWEIPALGNGALTQENLPRLAPAVADLNGDGQLEIVAATLDGWIRAYQADKTVLWAFNYTQGATLFASEPVIGDIDGDRSLEVVFGTIDHNPTENSWDVPVGLWAIKADGTVAPGFPLVIPTPGVRAAPALADLDGDGDLEILAATLTGQIFVWDTGTPANPARLPWPIGRHDIRRSATYTAVMPLEASQISVSPRLVDQGHTATFTIHIASITLITETLALTDTIPAGISYVPGTLTATTGVATESGGVIRWHGTLSDTLTMDITYQVVVDTFASRVITNRVVIDLGMYGLLTREAYLYANFSSVFLPLVRR
jgi:uncharacterized repeat protein (TIGR01451 family)